MDFIERRVVAAGVNSLQITQVGDWSGLTAEVGFDLSGMAPGEDGPAAVVSVSVEFSPDGSLRDAERAALKAAVAVLSRLVAEPLEELYGLQEASRQG